MLQGLLDGYDSPAYDPSPLTVDGARVESDVRFQYRQKATGEVIDSRLHHRWSTADGKVTRLEEWHDLPTVRAFFRPRCASCGEQRSAWLTPADLFRVIEDAL